MNNEKTSGSDATETARLQAKVEELEEKLEVAELDRDMEDIGRAKMFFATRAMAMAYCFL